MPDDLTKALATIVDRFPALNLFQKGALGFKGPLSRAAGFRAGRMKERERPVFRQHGWLCFV